jgi:hypothetical protein
MARARYEVERYPAILPPLGGRKGRLIKVDARELDALVVVIDNS